jgi:hypothetical protein
MVINRALPRYLVSGCIALFILIGCKKDVHSLDHLLGKNELAVISELGPPEKQQVIYSTENVRLHEYQSNLYKLFPNLRGEKIKIKEFQWRKNGDNIVVWFVYRDEIGIVVDTLGWTEKVRF